MDQKVNGRVIQELENDFFQTTAQLSTENAEEIDLEQYRAGQSPDLINYTSSSSTPKADCRKPRQKEWFRCSAEPLEKMWIYESDAGINEVFLVHRDVALELPDEFTEVFLALCVNPSGRVFLWPIKCGDGGQEFTEAALQHVAKARASWIRRRWVSSLRAHRIDVSDLEGFEPEWPQVNMREIISRAFADRLIRSVDHPCLRFVRHSR